MKALHLTIAREENKTGTRGRGDKQTKLKLKVLYNSDFERPEKHTLVSPQIYALTAHVLHGVQIVFCSAEEGIWSKGSEGIGSKVAGNVILFWKLRLLRPCK